MSVSYSYLIDSLSEPFHPSWETFLAQPEVTEQLAIITEALEQEQEPVTPETENIFRFMQMDIQQAKVVILGQDPYPQAGVATGRCFEVGTLESWEVPFKNVSLKNIIRALYSAESGKKLGYKDVLKARIAGWHLLPPQLLFKDWEKQGVLLLNTAFTCKIGSAGSHTKLWEPFTALLLQFIAEANKELRWFVWGKHAEKHSQDLPLKHKLVSQHPMMCYDRPERTDDFLFGKINMFAETNDLIQWTGSYIYEEKVEQRQQLKLF